MPEASEGHPVGVEQVRATVILAWGVPWCTDTHNVGFFSPKTKRVSRKPGQTGNSIRNYILTAAGVWLRFSKDQKGNAG